MCIYVCKCMYVCSYVCKCACSCCELLMGVSDRAAGLDSTKHSLHHNADQHTYLPTHSPLSVSPSAGALDASARSASRRPAVESFMRSLNRSNGIQPLNRSTSSNHSSNRSVLSHRRQNWKTYDKKETVRIAWFLA